MTALRTAEALAEAAAIVARRIPAPRGLPFYGLDHPPGVLERIPAHLSDLGIFRVYSHVLDLAGAFGGPARWLARRQSCRVTTIEPDPDLSSASAFLTARAFLGESVRSACAASDRRPFSGDTFTHAWRVSPPAEETDRRAVFAEAWRVLRPGGWLALAERAEASEAVAADLGAAGFRELVTTDLAPLVEDDSTATRLTAERTEAALGCALDRAHRDLPQGLVGLRARKPS